jgi:hypothetical protein
MLTELLEHFFSIMRSRNPTPDQLEYIHLHASAIKESLKKVTVTPFSYFTAVESFYQVPSSYIPFSALSFPPAPASGTLTQDQLHKLHDWRTEHGQGVRQRTVRAETTMDKAGTLPPSMYAREFKEAMPLEFVPVELESGGDWTYSAGDVLAIELTDPDVAAVLPGVIALALVTECGVGSTITAAIYRSSLLTPLLFSRSEAELESSINPTAVISKVQVEAIGFSPDSKDITLDSEAYDRVIEAKNGNSLEEKRIDDQDSREESKEEKHEKKRRPKKAKPASRRKRKHVEDDGGKAKKARTKKLPRTAESKGSSEDDAVALHSPRVPSRRTIVIPPRMGFFVAPESSESSDSAWGSESP